ncbi:MAG: hypothetical protein ACLU99_08650 [Alphaproteobacteria bacterium]
MVKDWVKPGAVVIDVESTVSTGVVRRWDFDEVKEGGLPYYAGSGRGRADDRGNADGKRL